MSKRTSYKKSTQIETSEFCSKGCGNIAKFKSRSGILLCCSSVNSCPEQRKKNSLGLHKCYDNGRDAKQISANMSEESKQRQAWNRGLTKDIDERVARPQLIGVRFGSGVTGHSIETKEKLSRIRTKILESSPHIQWMTLSNGVKVQGTWEYNVGECLLELGYSVSRNQIHYDGHRRYTPDFCIGENIYIEVKGWLSDNNIDKYRRVYKDNPNIKIYLIRDEKGVGNYTKFVSRTILLDECEDLREAIGS